MTEKQSGKYSGKFVKLDFAIFHRTKHWIFPHVEKGTLLQVEAQIPRNDSMLCELAEFWVMWPQKKVIKITSH